MKKFVVVIILTFVAIMVINTLPTRASKTVPQINPGYDISVIEKANVSDINAIIKIMHSPKLPENIVRIKINNPVEKGIKISFFANKGMVCFVSYFKESDLCGAILEIKIYSYKGPNNVEIIAEEAISNKFTGQVTFGEIRNQEVIGMRFIEISPHQKIGEEYRSYWQKRYAQVIPIIRQALQQEMPK